MIPGFVGSLAMSELVGLSLLAIWACATSRAAVLAVVAVVAVESAVGVLFLNKTMGADALVRLRDRRALLQPYDPEARHRWSIGLVRLRHSSAAGRLWQKRSVQQSGEQGAELSLSRNFEYLRSYFVDSKAESDPEAAQGGLHEGEPRQRRRLHDRSIRSRSSRRFDSRHASYSLFRAVLWPEKPLLLSGYELATLATGGVGNSISAGYFAETYWNFGWIGLPFCSCFRSEPFSTGPRVSRLERSRAKTGSMRRCCSSI